MSTYVSPEQLEKQRLENELIRQARIAKETEAKEAENKERNERDEALRKIKEVELKRTLQSSFLNANPSASVEDFERLYPTIRDEHLKNETEREYERQFASARKQYNLM